MEKERLLCHLNRYEGETVTIFTSSGGVSGCGFTGMLLSVNCDFVRILTRRDSGPSNPLSNNICCDMQGSNKEKHMVGSVCDIPVCSIVSFCHNAI